MARLFGDGPELAMCYVVEVENTHALRQSIDALKQKWSLEVRTDDYRGIRIHTLAGTSPVYWAVTDEVFLLAMERDGQRMMQGVVDQLVLRRAGEVPDEFPAKIQRRIDLGLENGDTVALFRANVLATYFDHPMMSYILVMASTSDTREVLRIVW